MKLHLLFVFLLAAPLIARVLSDETAPTRDSGGEGTTQSVEVRSVPATPNPAGDGNHKSSNASAVPTAPAHRIASPVRFTFM